MHLGYDYDQKQRAPRDYIASTSLRIRQDDLSKLAMVLDVASALDVGGLSDLRFRYDPTQADYDLALTRAVKASLHKAGLIAMASGQSLSFIQEFRESISGGGVVMARPSDRANPIILTLQRPRRDEDLRSNHRHLQSRWKCARHSGWRLRPLVVLWSADGGLSRPNGSPMNVHRPSLPHG